MPASKAKSAAEERIDHLMEQATDALTGTRYFECERLALEAMTLAHSARDFDRMARIVMPLQEARRLRRQLACDVKKLNKLNAYDQIEKLLHGGAVIKPGVYLLEPPLVGADGHELRDRALAEGVAILVIVREPMTRASQWPVVQVGPVTVRTRLAPPKKVDVNWVVRAAEAVGDEALAMVDPTDMAEDRVDHLVELLAAVPDHEKLHQALAAACREAATDQANGVKRRRSGRAPQPLDPEEAETAGLEEDAS